MFQIGDFIVYSSSGVCQIIKIGTLDSKTDRLYYTLKPVFGSEVIYTPTDTNVFMRPVLTKEDAEALISKIPFIQGEMCCIRNLSMLKEHYETSLQSHECEELVRLIKSVYAKSESASAQGKKLGQIDQRYMKRAEELLYGELSIALDIPRDDIVKYIEDSVEDSAEKKLEIV